MASLEPFVKRIKPALDEVLRGPSLLNLARLQYEISQYNFQIKMKIFHAQILLPLVLKLEDMNCYYQELRTGIMHCIGTLISKLYLNDVKELRSILIIVLKQIRDIGSATTKASLSEEIKLVAVDCISEALKRSSTDVLEQFYTDESSFMLGQILLTLVEFIEREKYKKLITASMKCLMVVFYVHDEADSMDVVLRNQVANSTFIYLPKIVTILFKTCLADEKLGEFLKSTAIRALGRILCIIYEETNESVIQTTYDVKEFQKLVDIALKAGNNSNSKLSDSDILGKKKSNEQLEDILKRMQGNGRSANWFGATSRKLRIVFVQTNILRSHESKKIREEYAQMCCTLIQRCTHNLNDNLIILLENVVAMSEDKSERVRHLCETTIHKLQQCNHNNATGLFDENCELLFHEHLTKLPRIINRCDDAEQYAELIFLKGFLRNLSQTRLQFLLSMPKNLEMFCMCLLSAIDLKTSHDLLIEEYSLRQINDEDFTECGKLHWRQYKNLYSVRCIRTIQEICAILGKTKVLNRIIFDLLLGMLTEPNEAMNEILLLLLWMATSREGERCVQLELIDILLQEILNDKHWHLALQPDHVWRLKVDKPTGWFVDRTPGLYESAIEIRTQDCDSDDENDLDNVEKSNRVTIADAQFNVLHTCIIMDALGHCATFYGERFDKYLFRSLHKVLLKVASSNSIIYKAANFALISMQKALRFAKTSHFIETYTDYITYHLNTILKRSPESKSAVDILTVVLQFSSRNALPHMESIFQTIRDECAKSYQSENIHSYLKVFNAFLSHVDHWKLTCDNEINNISPMQIDDNNDHDIQKEGTDLLTDWLSILQKPAIEIVDKQSNETENINNVEKSSTDLENEAENAADTKAALPRHIEMIKDILNQVVKFISSSEKTHQILALECLISGLPLLKEYENELLPLVHLIWQPLVEKFRQKDAVVLHRCFMLLNILATHAKEFILKRSLDDIIPFLKQFLKEAAIHSATENITAQTQEYKLQLKLLQEFSNLIQCMQIDDKNLNEIMEAVSIYLSHDQRKELQDHAVQFFQLLRAYNSPLVYLVVLKKSHLKHYKDNVAKVLAEFAIK